MVLAFGQGGEEGVEGGMAAHGFWGWRRLWNDDGELKGCVVTTEGSFSFWGNMKNEDERPTCRNYIASSLCSDFLKAYINTVMN